MKKEKVPIETLRTSQFSPQKKRKHTHTDIREEKRESQTVEHVHCFILMDEFVLIH